MDQGTAEKYLTVSTSLFAIHTAKTAIARFHTFQSFTRRSYRLKNECIIMAHTVAFLLLNRFKMLDLIGPLQVFSDCNEFVAANGRYECGVYAVCPQDCTPDVAIGINVRSYKEIVGEEIDTLYVIGSRSDGLRPETRNVLSMLANTSKRIASVCVGTFALANAGLLSERRAVTHWMFCKELQAGFPNIHVERDPIFIRDENVWTSAGVTAGIDMALEMVGVDHGRKLALKVAKSLVTYMVRPGGQCQFSDVLETQIAHASNKFEALIDYIYCNPSKELSVEQMAAISNMSQRSFARHFVAAFNMTPSKYVEKVRLDLACKLLVDTKLPLKLVAVKSGFGAVDRFRRCFLRNYRISPQKYRDRFS